MSSDATFDSDDSFVALTDDGNGNYEGTVDFADGDYFTFGVTPAFIVTSLADTDEEHVLWQIVR